MDEVEYCIVRKNNRLAADEIRKLAKGTITTEQVNIATQMLVFAIYYGEVVYSSTKLVGALLIHINSYMNFKHMLMKIRFWCSMHS